MTAGGAGQRRGSGYVVLVGGTVCAHILDSIQGKEKGREGQGRGCCTVDVVGMEICRLFGFLDVITAPADPFEVVDVPFAVSDGEGGRSILVSAIIAAVITNALE